MSILPAVNYFSDGSRTEGEQKQAFEDQRGVISELLGGSIETELTISSGSITPTGGAHRVDTEADASTDFLTHIDYSNHPEGRYLIIHPENATRVITVTHGAGGDGQIILSGSSDLVLLNTDNYLLLHRVGSTWVEITRFIPSGWNLIQTQNASASASIDFTSGLSTTYNNYMIKISNMTPANDATTLQMRVSQSATFLFGANDYAWVRHVIGTLATNTLASLANDTLISLAHTVSNTSGRVLEATILFGHPAASIGYKNFMFDNVYMTSSSEFTRIVGMGVFKLNNNAIDGIRFLMSAGNISVGTFALYGLRKS